MDFKIIAPGADEIEIVNRLPKHFTGKKLPYGNSISTEAKFGAIIYQNYSGDGFEIWLSEYDIRHKTVLIGRADIPLLELHMHIENTAETKWDCTAEKIVRPYQYNLTYLPHMDNRSKFEEKRTYKTFDIHFSRDYLEQLAPFFPPLDHFLQKVNKGIPTVLNVNDRFLKPVMITIIDHILNCPFNRDQSRFYIEAKVIELLLLVLHEAMDENPLAPIKLNAYEIERLHEAKDLVVSNFEDPLTIPQLSKRVALNEFKLKKGFKYLFGATIFEYMNKVRMEKALKMLLETELEIRTIASMSGFNDVSNFNIAFKKYFKCTAAFIRRTRKLPPV